MGFFSKIKSIFKGKPAAPAPAEPAAPQAPAAPPAATPAETPAEVPSPPAAPPAPAAAPPAEAKLLAAADWQKDLTLALRSAEPRLSEWLKVALAGVEKRGDLLRERLLFLFAALEAPADEARDFVDRFEAWLDTMEYERLADFRSELQYRLALALDLEDEEDERSRLMLKLSAGLEKTKERITRQIDGLLSGRKELDEAFWEELEEVLIMADVGMDAVTGLTRRLRDRVRKDGARPEDFKAILREELAAVFTPVKRITAVNPPEVVLMIGVNGVGKTTTIAKLAHRASMQGKKVLIAAGDTFRAAAMEQLQIWAGRVGAGFYAKGEGADPAAVAFEAVDEALRGGYDILFVDTAGRLHTKTNLMEELKKVKAVLGKKHPGAPHRCVLVVDATTGQNAISQTKLFSEAVGVDEIVLTKLDGTAKGGVVVAIALQFKLPISFIGLGEKMEDLRPFSGEDFASALLGD
ncbi:MAG: signal recognition particle-docking protein FtsY [Thermodesulfobacteriota bacterium]